MVLYLGSHIGIRQQLQLVTLKGFNLSSVFELTHIGSRGRTDLSLSATPTNALAEVVTAYAPAAPRALIEQCAPDLILLDLADATESHWLEVVLKCASERLIPVLGWGVNPLSECVAPFTLTKSAFVWPMSAFFSDVVPPGNLYLSSPQEHSTHALVLTADDIKDTTQLFHRIYGLLLRASRAADGTLGRKVVGIHWGYLRTVESICIPGDLYESESERYWGHRSVAGTSEFCARFREALSLSTLTADLELAATLIDEVWGIIRKSPPLWNALLNLCFDDSPLNPKVIRFKGRARKQMFLLALLAQLNITEQDLKDINIEILTLDDAPPAYKHDAYIAGIPGVRSIPRLTSFLAANESQFIIFPHQLRSLEAQIRAMSKLLSPEPEYTAEVIEKLEGVASHSHSQREQYSITLSPLHSPLHLADPKEILAIPRGGPATPRSYSRPLIEADSAVAELARLLERSGLDEEPDSTESLDEHLSDVQDNPEHETQEVCTKSLRVRFRENCMIDFPHDARVQVVVSASNKTQLQERYASSLRPNEKILYIEGQRRQNLYDLILSRVHKHPSFQIHLALIRRWQDDLRLAYSTRKNATSAEEVLIELQHKGSKIQTSLTVRNWLNGLCLCPDDPEDLRRLAEIMGLGFVADQYKRIHKAAQRIRGLHIGLGLRLCGWLEGAAKGLDDDTEVFDEELGLTFADFKTSLVVLTVQSVSAMDGLFLRSTLGKLEYDQEG
jgi:hypothetical protein